MKRASRTLLGGLILLILLLAICAGVVWHATSSSWASRRLAQHSIAVMQAAETLLSEVQDAETGQRGYILTRQEQYLAPFRAALTQIPPAFDGLRALLTNTPAEADVAERLRGAIHTKLFELAKTVEVAQNEGFDAAVKIVLTDIGKQAMDEIRGTIRSLVQQESEIVSANRADVYYWDRVNLIIGGAGGAIVLIALSIAAWMIHRGIDQLHLAEQNIREQAGLLQGTLDNVRDGVVAFDADGRLTAANRRFFRLMKFPPGLERPGARLAEFLAAEADRPERIFVDGEAAAEAASEGGVVRRISIEKRDLEVYRNAMPQGGFIVTCKDITQRLRTEAGLRQAQKMESIGQLTGGVAHDFNNLLQVVIGNIEFLIGALKDAPALLTRARSALLASQRGAQLTRQLLAFARRQPLNPAPINPGRLIQGMTDLLQRTLGDDIQVEASIAGGLWNTLVDAAQLESAILNLAINARDAMPEGGKLTIEVANAFLDDAYAAEHADVAPGQYVMLAVTDTGTGMTPDVVARAFEPFFTTKPEGKGTGLGLSMVYGLVKQSGGHVKIYSEPGHGTTMKLYLPREHGAEVATNGLNGRAAVGGNERILVVEDDATVRQTVVDMLRQLGYRIAIAESGEQALDLLKGGMKIDLLFTDVVMPGPVGGRELARQAAALLPGLFVLYTSGYTENAVIHHGRLDPGLHLLSKPYGIEELGHKLRLVFAGTPGGPPAAQADSAALVPAVAAAPAQAPVQSPSQAAVVDATILLVEDDALVAMSTMDMLAQLGLSAEEAANGAEAIELFRNKPALALVIADIGLPDMDGHALVREMRRLRPAVKIIMATGSVTGTSSAEDDGANVIYLGKPYQLADLKRAIERLRS